MNDTKPKVNKRRLTLQNLNENKGESEKNNDSFILTQSKNLDETSDSDNDEMNESDEKEK